MNRTQAVRYAIAAVLALATAGGLASCGSGETSKSSGSSASGSEAGSPIKIGAVIGRSGPIEPFDGPSFASFELRVKQINERGGINGRPLEIVVGDTKSVIERTPTVAQKLISEGADIMLVSCDFDFGSPAARVAQNEGLLSVSLCASSPKFGAQAIGDKAFTLSPSVGVEGATMAQYAISRGWTTAYTLLDDTLSYTRGVCSAFTKTYKELGGRIVGKDSFKNDDSSFATQLNAIEAARASVVALCSYPPGGASIVRQLRAGGNKAPVVGGIGFDGTYWLDSVPNRSELYVVAMASTSGDDPRPAVNQWVEDFEAEYGEVPSKSQSLTGYAVAEAIEAALNTTEGDTDGAALAAALENFDGQKLVYGPVTLRPGQHIPLDVPMAVLSYSDAKPAFEKLEPPTVKLSVADGAG